MTNVNRHNACDREKVLALKGIRTELRYQSLLASVSGIGHSDICGLVTNRSMVRRECYRLREWIKICQHSIFVDHSNRKCPKLLRDAFQHKCSAAVQPLIIHHHKGMAGSRSQLHQQCKAALTLAARRDSLCVMLRHYAPDKTGLFSGNRRFCNIGFLPVLQGQPIAFDGLQFVCGNPCSCGDVLIHIIQVNPRLYKLEVITYCLIDLA